MSGKTAQELIEYIDLINDQLTVKYGKVVDLTRSVLKNSKLDDIKRSYLEWSLAHLHADMVQLHEDLKNMQKSLRENGKDI